MLGSETEIKQSTSKDLRDIGTGTNPEIFNSKALSIPGSSERSVINNWYY